MSAAIGLRGRDGITRSPTATGVMRILVFRSGEFVDVARINPLEEFASQGSRPAGRHCQGGPQAHWHPRNRSQRDCVYNSEDQGKLMYSSRVSKHVLP